MKREPAAGCRWHHYPDTRTLARNAAGMIARISDECLRTRVRFKLVLAGGETPRATYECLAGFKLAWEAWEIFFGDERCLPVDDAMRNSRMAAEAWLDHVAIPRERIHPIPAERGAEAAARAYDDLVTRALPFDLVLLGLGEDGHTASLFPGRDYGQALVVPVHDAPKPPAERVSLTGHSLTSAQRIMFLVSGESKRTAVAAWLRGDAIPAAGIAAAGNVDILIDGSAWPGTGGS